jgi:hypothetical protein
VADFWMARSLDANGQPVYEALFTPTGDRALISGLPLLTQNILLYMDTALGTHPTDPLFGTDLQADIGQPLSDDLSTYTVTLSACEAYFKAQAAATPTTPLDEQIDHISDVNVTLNPAQMGDVLLSFTVWARSGNSLSTSLSTVQPQPLRYGSIYGASTYGAGTYS